MFSRGDDIHTSWLLRLTVPTNRRALIHTPDSDGWSLDVDPGQNSATIGCDTDRSYAEVLWIGPETSHAFHTTLRGVLSSCGGGGGGMGGTPPWFRLEIVDGLVVLTPSEATAVPGQSVLYEAFTRRGEVAGEADRQPALVTWASDSTDVIFSAEEGGPALQEGQLTRGSVWVRATTIGAHPLIALPAEREQQALHATLHVSGVERITVTPGDWPDGRDLPDEIHLAAGGFESPAHQGKVRIHLYPPIADLSVNVAVLNGGGRNRNARLAILDQVLYGDQGGILLTSNAQGFIEGTLTTGDTLGTVEIQADHLTAMVRQSWVDPLDMPDEWEARFEDRDAVLTDYAFINGGGKMHYRVPFLHRRIPGDPDSPVVPMDQHEIRFLVEELVYLDAHGNQQIITNSPSEPNPAVEEWTSFAQAVFTDSDGLATTFMNIADRVELVSLSVIPYDYSICSNTDVNESPSAMQGPAASTQNPIQDASTTEIRPSLSPEDYNNNYAVIAYAPSFILREYNFKNNTSFEWNVAVFLGGYDIDDFGIAVLDSSGNTVTDGFQIQKIDEIPFAWTVTNGSTEDRIGDLYVGHADLNRFVRFKVRSSKVGAFRLCPVYKGSLSKLSKPFEVIDLGCVLRLPEQEPAPLTKNSEEIPIHVFPLSIKDSTNSEVPTKIAVELHQTFSPEGAFLAKFNKNLPSGNGINIERVDDQNVKIQFEVQTSLFLSALYTTSLETQRSGVIRNLDEYLKVQRFDTITRPQLPYIGSAKTPPIVLIPVEMESIMSLDDTNGSFLFDGPNQSGREGKGFAMCNFSNLPGIHVDYKSVIWEMLEWVMPDIGEGDNKLTALPFCEPYENGRSIVFMYDGMPVHNDHFGSAEISVRFKDRKEWSQMENVNFRFWKDGVAASSEHHEKPDFSYVKSGNPNWYVYWTQAAKSFTHEVSGNFGPHTMMVYNPAFHSPDGKSAKHWINGTTEEGMLRTHIEIFSSLYLDIVNFIKSLHHENGHAASLGLPANQGGWGANLVYVLENDLDRDYIQNEWESGPTGAGLGFSISENNFSQRIAWDHGWISLVEAQNGMKNGEYIKPDGYDPQTDRGLCCRNEAHVEEKRDIIISLNWAYGGLPLPLPIPGREP